MKKTSIFVIVLLVACISSGFAQQATNETDFPYIKGQFHIGLAAMRVSDNSGQTIGVNVPICPSLEVNYGLTHWLEVGETTTLRFLNIGGVNQTFQNYSLNAKAHLLTTIISPSYYLFDVYATANAGMAVYPIKNIEGATTRTKFTWGGNVGMAVNPSRHFGLFAECGYLDAWYFKQYWRFGFNIRFGVPKKWQKNDID